MFGRIIYYDKKIVAEYKSLISGKPNLEIEEYDVPNDKGINAGDYSTRPSIRR